MITGSGKDTPSGPTTTPEYLRSIGTARILDLISEGPIVGLVNGDASVLLSGTPLRDSKSGIYAYVMKDGSPAVSVNAANLGTPDQGYIPGFDTVESETAVGATILSGQPVIQRIQPGIDRLRLRLSTPALYAIDDQGNTRATQILYAIDVKDSLTPEFPPVSALSTPVELSSHTPVDVTVAGYTRVLELALAPLAQPGLTLNQLRYYLYIQAPAGQGVPGFTLEVWVGFADGTFTQRSTRTVAGNGEAYMNYNLAAKQYYVEVSAQCTNVQFRVTSTKEVKIGYQNDYRAGNWTLAGLYGTTGQNGYLAMMGPPFVGNHPSKFEISTLDYDLLGVGPWDVRVTKMQEDSKDAKVQQTLQWESYTEIIDSKLSYPNCAVFSVVASAQQFSSVPVRGYHCRLLIVKVPTNYFPAVYNADGTWTAAKYTRNALGQDTGVEQGWDGTFYMAYTSNPAWCYYNLVTHTRYGLGKYIDPNNVNKWALYQIGRYCDGLVPSGFTNIDGTPRLEPRFTLNCYISTRSQAYALLQNLTSAFRGMVYWAAGKVTAIQDAPTDPVHPFTNSNVDGGTFTYSGTAKRARHNAALVVWNDPGNSYQQTTEYVDDPEGIRRYGYNPTTINTFGCTSRGQAHRFGKWAIYSELNETETCTHRTGLEGAVVMPGEVYKVLDASRSGVRYGGRVLSATGTSVTLDSEVTLEAGKSYTITFVAMTSPPTLETVAVSSAGVTTDVLVIAPTTAPLPGTPWILESPDHLDAQLFRCVSVTEVSPGMFEVIGLAYSPGKFAWVERDVMFDDAPISGQLPPDTIIAPTGVMISIEDRLNSVGVMARTLYLSWDIVQQACIRNYEAEYNIDGGSWIKVTPTGLNKVEIVGPASGQYVGRVRSINTFGTPSEWVETNYTVTPRVDSVPDVTGLQLLGQGNNQIFVDRDARFAWNQVIPPNATTDQMGDTSFGVGTAYPTGWLAGYLILVYNENGTLRRTDRVSTEQYTYSYDKNCLDGGVDQIPTRSFTIEVYAKTITGDTSVKPARLSVSNPAPAVLA